MALSADVNPDGSIPRVFLIQSPFLDPTGNNYVLGFGQQGGTTFLTLQEQPRGVPQLNQLFRVYEIQGQVQNLALEEIGFWTRVAVGNTIQVQLGTADPDSVGQDWRYAKGPVPNPIPESFVPGGGTTGSDRYTIVATKIEPKNPNPLVNAQVLTVQLDAQGKPILGAPILVADPIQKLPDPRRLADQQIWFYYWIPKAS